VQPTVAAIQLQATRPRVKDSVDGRGDKDVAAVDDLPGLKRDCSRSGSEQTPSRAAGLVGVAGRLTDVVAAHDAAGIAAGQALAATVRGRITRVSLTKSNVTVGRSLGVQLHVGVDASVFTLRARLAGEGLGAGPVTAVLKGRGIARRAIRAGAAGDVPVYTAFEGPGRVPITVLVGVGVGVDVSVTVGGQATTAPAIGGQFAEAIAAVFVGSGVADAVTIAVTGA
jgi:hypothetical protein